ncbi:MAG: galactonate dehydratase [Chloroflexi bacterium]|nr:galactonate dehydratase [Chloroflexota bacterium]
MKITSVRAFVVDELGTNRVFAKVYTDEGLTGLGEGTLASRSQSVAAAIVENERYLIDQDPRDIEGLWQHMYRRARFRGGPIFCSAISALDIALWDILGKSLNVPIYRLLGGACRERVRIYVGVGGPSPEAAADDARAAVEAGYTGVKTGPAPMKDGAVNPHDIVWSAVAKVKAIREAVGEDIEIAYDCHGVFTPVMALEFAQRVQEYRPMFLEEATQPEDLDTLAWLGQRTAVPLATGERLFTKWGFTDLVARHLVSYVQPDVAHAGGITELKKIATLAQVHFIDMAPHHGNSEVTTFASLHVDASSPNCVIQERPRKVSALSEELLGGSIVIREGFAELPDRPGLGLELNEKVAEKHPFDPDTERTGRARLTWADGAMTDP